MTCSALESLVEEKEDEGRKLDVAGLGEYVLKARKICGIGRGRRG